MGCSASAGCRAVDAPEAHTRRTFADEYNRTEKIGQGAFSTVYQVVHKKTGLRYAAKIVLKAGLAKECEEAVTLEVAILREIQHPSIIQLHDFLQDKKGFYIVTEMMEGGKLFDRIATKKAYTEKEARNVVFQLLAAVKYLHDRNIVHRDLKPENLLLTSINDDAQIKVADLGFAERTNGMRQLTLQCGTPEYVAPEIIKGESYGTPVDMWSVGVITYLLLGGYHPFLDENVMVLFSKIRRGRFYFDQGYWETVSSDAKDLICKLLKVNPLERLTVDEAIRHPWIMTSPDQLAHRDLAGTLAEMRRFNARRKFRALIKTYIAASRMQRLIGGLGSTAG